MDLYAGYDSGGSSTVCALADQDGNVLSLGKGGPSNYLFCSREVARQSFEDASQEAFSKANLPKQKLKAAYVASASIRLFHGKQHIPFLSTCIDAEHIYCDSDIVPLWFGEKRFEPAVLQILGTGAITFYCAKEDVTRVSGWGPFLGDEGSGFDIGRQALQLLVRMLDGRIPRDDQFIEDILHFYDSKDAYELILAVNKGDFRSNIASITSVIFSLAKRGNETASQLLDIAVEEVCLAIETALDGHKEKERKFDLILSGGLVEAKGPMYERIEAQVLNKASPIASILIPRKKPAVSSAALALHYENKTEAVEKILNGDPNDGN